MLERLRKAVDGRADLGEMNLDEMHWIDLAQDVNHWRALVNTEMSRQVL
jgi:hypothetical protein